MMTRIGDTLRARTGAEIQVWRLMGGLCVITKSTARTRVMLWGPGREHDALASSVAYLDAENAR